MENFFHLIMLSKPLFLENSLAPHTSNGSMTATHAIFIRGARQYITGKLFSYCSVPLLLDTLTIY